MAELDCKLVQAEPHALLHGSERPVEQRGELTVRVAAEVDEDERRRCIAQGGGDFGGARTQFAALKDRARAAGDAGMVAVATLNLDSVAWDERDYLAALAHASEAVELFRDAGDHGGAMVSLGVFAWSAMMMSDFSRAESLFREVLILGGRLGAVGRVADGATGLGVALVARGDEERGTRLLAAAVARFAELGRGFDDELTDVCTPTR